MSRANSKKFKPVLKSFNCPNCGAALDIKALGLTVTVVCKSCNSLIDANDPNFKILEKYQKSRKVQPDIPIGSKGVFSGYTYECIGFMQKRDGPYFWMEYLLYNPYVGFKWLVEVDGHWSISKKVYLAPTNARGNSFKHKGQYFKLFNNGSATVSYVEGEFYWRVKVGDSSNVRDYISPPYMLSYEWTKDEKNFSLGRYLTKDRVKEIFKLKELPYQSGVGANQPSQFKDQLRELNKYLLLAVFVIFGVYFFRVATADREIIYTESFIAESIPKFREKPKKIKTPTFTIENHKKNLEVEYYAGLSNQWIYLDTVLVHAKTGKGIPLTKEVSYYSGYSGGESWSEGSRKKTKLVFNVPQGEYFLSIHPQIDYRRKQRIRFKVTLKSDVVINSNLWIALFLIFIWPLTLFFKRGKFERDRWSNSDYSPYEDY